MMLLTKGRIPVLCLGLTLVVLAAYANHFQNRFHFDDAPTVVENRFVRDLRNIPGFFTDSAKFSINPAGQVYRPVVTTSLALDYRLAKNEYKPFAFHLSTFLWYCVQVILLFFLFRRIMDTADPHPSNLWVAWLAAACYGLHPANAETVNYVIQRGDVYTTLGVVASILVFAAFPEKRKLGFYLIPAILAFLSKAPALIYPALLLAYIYLIELRGWFGDWDKNREKGVAALRAAVPAILVTLLFGLLTWKMTPSAYSGGSTSPWLYRVTQPWVWLHYFKEFFLPTDLTADADWTVVSNPFAWEALVGYGFVAALIWAAIRTSRRRETRPIAFGILWFMLALLPTSLMALADVTNDHRMFFPFVGLTLAAFWTLRVVVFRKTERLTTNPSWVKGSLVTVGILLVLAGLGTHFRNQVWATEDSLWRDVTIKSPNNPRGLMNYGLSFLTKRQFGNAYTYLQRAEALDPTYAPVQGNLGLALAGLDRQEEAEQHFKRALDLAPALPESHLYYGRWLMQVGRLEDARKQAEAAIQINRLYLPGRDLLAGIYKAEGNRQGYNDTLEETVRLTFGEEMARKYMQEQAAKEKDARLSRFPNLKPEELLKISAQMCKTGAYDDCLGAAEKAVQLRPGYAEAYNNMAAAFLSMGRLDEGIEAAKQALQAKPDYRAAKNNLDWGLQQKAKTGKK